MCKANLRPKLYRNEKGKYKRWISWIDFNELIISIAVTSWEVIISGCSLYEI